MLGAGFRVGPDFQNNRLGNQWQWENTTDTDMLKNTPSRENMLHFSCSQVKFLECCWHKRVILLSKGKK